MNDMAGSGYIASVFSFMFFFCCCFETSIGLMGLDGERCQTQLLKMEVDRSFLPAKIVYMNVNTQLYKHEYISHI